MLQFSDIYVFDTSSFIKLKEYPNDLWERIKDMIRQGRIRAPIQVYKEITRQDDEITNFVKSNKDIFVDIYKDKEIREEVNRIMEKYPKLIKSERVSSNNECADPYVIAMAKVLQARVLEGRAIVVTEDIRDRRGEKSSIRSVCNAEDIECITLSELFRREGII